MSVKLRGSGACRPFAARVALATIGACLLCAAPGPSTAAATHLTDTGSPGGPTVPWGFNEGWGFSPGAWSADLATRQLGLAGAIIPDSLSANRFHVSWLAVEAQRDDYDWSRTDHTYNAMRATGDRPVMLILSAPAWARDPAATCPIEGVTCSFPPAPEHDAEWSEFVEDAVARYPEVRAIEVYNEPNLARFWAPAPDPGRYVEVLGLAHDAAAAAGSGAPVITGGLSPVRNTNETRTSSREFLREIYNQGCACDFEGIGTHTYPRTEPLVDDMWRELDRLRAVRDNHNDPGTPLWITEVAVSSDATEGVGIERQGEELVRLYRSIEDHDVESFTVHRLHDVTDESPYWNHTGIVDQNLAPKPAYCELGAAIGEACPEPPPAPTPLPPRAPLTPPPAKAGSASLASDPDRPIKVRKRIPLKILCGGEESCEGSVEVKTAKRVSLAAAIVARRRVVKLAKKTSFSIAAGRRETVRAKLTRKGRKLLRRKRRVRAKVTITTRGADGARTTTERIKIKRRR